MGKRVNHCVSLKRETKENRETLKQRLDSNVSLNCGFPFWWMVVWAAALLHGLSECSDYRQEWLRQLNLPYVPRFDGKRIVTKQLTCMSGKSTVVGG